MTIRPCPARGRVTLLGISIGLLSVGLAACSSGATSATGTPAGSTAANAPANTAAAASTAASASAAGNASDAGTIDVCALLSAADASAVATKFQLSSQPGATYKLMAEKLAPPTTSYPTSACRFTIAEVTADNTGSEAIVSVTVQPAQYLDKTGTKVDGLGDEAYDEGSYVEVRAGDVILQSNENSGASKDFIDALYRAMIPNVK